ncbi:hypothetical protein M407DRAFT_20322 [Tulasnella calospora MUT 4182]|uniref:F-box domain-containing protein n=1 Tax=Tulasnella calospora MUT 4182 TaxID=1051891 RepID=A0A0C3QQ77_9AGAM|nr:hypothetical protein M407DRAFT_20322 [Tulasnella calospora MUT 4182]
MDRDECSTTRGSHQIPLNEQRKGFRDSPIAELRGSGTGKTRIICRKKERNNLVRFNQLPSEIIGNILSLSIADPWIKRFSFSFLQRRQTISSVCSSGRTLVEGSPQFWSIIEFTNSQPAILALLEKFKSSPLEICFSAGWYSCAPEMDRTGRVTETYLELIAPHTHRIRSLIVSAHSTNGILALLDKPAPLLEELELSFSNFIFVQPVELFLGRVERLKDVTLENISSATEMQVLRFLEANSELEEMGIEDVSVTESSTADVVGSVVGERGRVVMGNMRGLKLFNLSLELVQVIMGNVEISSIRHLDLECLCRQLQLASKLLGPKIQHLVSPIL